MSQRFIKFIPSEKADWLDNNHPNAFRLLRIIAQRARRYSGHIDGLQIGECFIGDSGWHGMSQQNYRTAKKILEEHNFIKIIETRRKPKNSTTKSTTKGTLVKLIDNSIWDINEEKKNIEITTNLTTSQRPANDQLTTNKKEQERTKKEKNMNPLTPETGEPAIAGRSVEIEKKEQMKEEHEPRLTYRTKKYPGAAFITYAKLREELLGQMFTLEQINAAIEIFKIQNPKIGGLNPVSYIKSIIEHSMEESKNDKYSHHKNSVSGKIYDFTESVADWGPLRPQTDRRENSANSGA